MKNTRIGRQIILLFIIVTSISSCNRPEGKDPSKGEYDASAVIDTPARPAPSPINSGKIITPEPSTGAMPESGQPSNPNNSAPIGSIPLLHPEQLTQFHPKLTDFILSNVQEVNEKTDAQSIILFRFRNDTTRTLKSSVMDANESMAGKQIMAISHMQKIGHETRVVDGESITSYYTEINGMPAIKAYILSKKVATLFVFVGDHRAVAFRENKVPSSDHLIEAAKTIDFKKLETLSRN